MRIIEKALAETFDVFEVQQLTRATSLEDFVAVDRVEIQPEKASQIHRHNSSDTVLYIVSGSGVVIVGEESLQVKAGDRIHIAPGVFHGVRTSAQALSFISIQSPPILNKKTGVLDLEEQIKK